jgi:hypothetical protein
VIVECVCTISGRAEAGVRQIQGMSKPSRASARRMGVYSGRVVECRILWDGRYAGCGEAAHTIENMCNSNGNSNSNSNSSSNNNRLLICARTAGFRESTASLARRGVTNGKTQARQSGEAPGRCVCEAKSKRFRARHHQKTHLALASGSVVPLQTYSCGSCPTTRPPAPLISHGRHQVRQ